MLEIMRPRKRRLDVELDASVVHSGERVSGRCVLRLADQRQQLVVKAVRVRIVGVAKIHIRDVDGRHTKRSMTVLDERVNVFTLVRCSRWSDKKQTSVEGENSNTIAFPFSVVLPAALPSTFVGECGTISYFAKATMCVVRDVSMYADVFQSVITSKRSAFVVLQASMADIDRRLTTSIMSASGECKVEIEVETINTPTEELSVRFTVGVENNSTKFLLTEISVKLREIRKYFKSSGKALTCISDVAEKAKFLNYIGKGRFEWKEETMLLTRKGSDCSSTSRSFIQSDITCDLLQVSHMLVVTLIFWGSKNLTCCLPINVYF